MTMKLVVGSVCMLVSMAIFPLFAIGGAAALFVIALGMESIRSLTGAAAKRVDYSTARTMAMHICHNRAIR